MLENRLSTLLLQLDQIAEHCAQLEAENQDLKQRHKRVESEKRALLKKCRKVDERLIKVVERLKTLPTGSTNPS